VQGAEDVEPRGVAVRVLARRERLRFPPLLAAEQIGEELEERVGRRAEIGMVQEMLAQGPLANQTLRPGAELAMIASTSPRGSPRRRRGCRRPRNRCRSW
jgi:hypothetical protein